MRETAFVALMEEGLDLYVQPYDARYPVICRTNRPNRGWSQRGRRARRGRAATCDYEYVQHGAGTIRLFVKPLDRRTANATAGARPWTGRARCRS